MNQRQNITRAKAIERENKKCLLEINPDLDDDEFGI